MLVPALLPGVSEDQQKKLGKAHGAIFRAKYLDRVKAFPQAHALLAHVQASGKRVVFASSASKWPAPIGWSDAFVSSLTV